MESRALEISLSNSTLKLREMTAVEISDQIGCAELKTFPALHHASCQLVFVGSDRVFRRIEDGLQIVQAVCG